MLRTGWRCTKTGWLCTSIAHHELHHHLHCSAKDVWVPNLLLLQFKTTLGIGLPTKFEVRGSCWHTALAISFHNQRLVDTTWHRWVRVRVCGRVLCPEVLWILGEHFQSRCTWYGIPLSNNVFLEVLYLVICNGRINIMV